MTELLAPFAGTGEHGTQTATPAPETTGAPSVQRTVVIPWKTTGTSLVCSSTAGTTNLCTAIYSTAGTGSTYYFPDTCWADNNYTNPNQYWTVVRQTELAARAREAAVYAENAAWPEAGILALTELSPPRIVARDLMLSLLSDRQRAELEQHRHFSVQAPSGRRYRIHVDSGRHGNIIELDAAGEPRSSLCVAPGGGLPDEDCFVAQALFIAHDEAELRRVANITDYRTGRMISLSGIAAA